MRKTFPKLTALLLTLALALAMSAPALAVFGGGDLSLVKPGPRLSATRERPSPSP